MTEGPIGKAAATLALLVCVAGIVLPFFTPAPLASTVLFGVVLLTLVILWAKSDR